MTRCLKQVVYLVLHCLHVLRCLHNAVDEKTHMSEVVVRGRDGVQFPFGAHHALEHNS